MAQCRSCEAPIIWVQTTAGKNMPVDEAPTDDGNLVVINGKARFATSEDRRLRRPLYKSHFSTCSFAGDWRKR